MRTSGVCLALAATAQLVLFSSAPAFADGTPAGATVVVAPAPAPAQASDGTINVHINSGSPVVLQRRSGGAEWQTVCTSPCDARVPAGDEYQIVGDNLNPSRPFHFDATKGDAIRLDVAPGVKSRASTGTALAVTGAIIAVGGLATMIAAAAVSGGHSVSGEDGATTQNGYTNVLFVGGAILFVGLGVGLYGLGTHINNSQTAIGGDVQADRGPEKATADNATRALAAAANQRPAFVLPVFSGRF